LRIRINLVFQFFFAGFGEEILFRGYMQSRLNEDFGRPWRLRGVSFGQKSNILRFSYYTS
jgi:hypothetical protein